MKKYGQIIIKAGLTLDLLRLLPISILSCIAARSLNLSFTFVHALLVIVEVIIALYLFFDQHSKSAWVISFLLHLYEVAFWCIVFWQEGLGWANVLAFPFPPFLMSLAFAYVLYQYYGYEKARKYHSAV